MFPVLLVALIAYFQGEVKDWKNATPFRIWTGLFTYQLSLTTLSFGSGGIAYLLITATGDAATSLYPLFYLILAGVAAFLALNLVTVSSRAAGVLNDKLAKKREEQLAATEPEDEGSVGDVTARKLNGWLALIGAFPLVGVSICVWYVVYQAAH
jgi:hypothetical protein